jgi:hypothetical protein
MNRSVWFVTVIAFGTAIGACGGGAEQLDDAPPPSDGGGFERPPPRVAVSVRLGGMPVMGLFVYFQNHDSTLASEAQTNIGGNAAGVVDDGGFVTVIEPPPLSAVEAARTRLVTFAGVKLLDELHVDVSPLGFVPPPVTFNLSVPDEQLGNTYTLYSSCGTQAIGVGTAPVRAGAVAAVAAVALTTSVTLTGCDGMADMLVVSTDAGGKLVGWQYQPNVAVADAANIAFTGAYLPPVDTTFTYTQISPTSTGLGVVRELRTARGSVYRSAQATAPSGGVMATVTIPMPAPVGVQAITTSTDQPSTGNGRQTIVEWGAADQSYLLDYAGAALRDYATRPALDTATQAITWTEAAGAAPDFVLGTYRADRADVVPHETIRRIVAPYATDPSGLATLQYPTLPTTLYDFNARTGDLISLERLVTMKVPGGYDAARAGAFDSDIPTAIVGATGRIVYQELVLPPLAVQPAAAAPPISRTLPRGRFTPRAR